MRPPPHKISTTSSSTPSNQIEEETYRRSSGNSEWSDVKRALLSRLSVPRNSGECVSGSLTRTHFV
ncbi:hypothetical protein J6590_073496 [Homalodisca vitripennis]|nr:hypothetical protein J6590_073496 [Homalodisca vitripennis]